MEKWKGKIAVVTGASSGIGAAIFRDMAAVGIQVIGLALCNKQTEEVIKNSENGPKNMYALHCDVTNEQSVKSAFQWIASKFGGIDILVNNAGCGRCTTILSDDNETDLRTVIETNIYGLLLCTKGAYDLMNGRCGLGFIININSIKGHTVPFIVGVEPNTNIYAGTKHAVTAATEVLRQELIFMKKENIRVSSVSPGVVSTNFNDAAGNPKNTSRRPILQAEDVSDAVMYLLSTKSHVNITELTIKPVGEPF